MYHFLSEIFATNSDKARLISILISSIVAVGILLLNQWFINKRERRNLYIEKIEEISKLVSECDRYARKFFFAYDDNASNESKPNGNASIALQDMEMLLNLYFPNDVFVVHEKQYEALLNLKNCLMDYPDNDIKALASWENVRRVHAEQVAEMHSNCRSIVKKYT
ncbi:hypothetical protein F2Z80_17980 [Vibrio fortis]|uniref:DUF4760 domain-containing protein n=1 Tax=Vibrio fortis TaxID=212667 RepID=A0A5N3S2C7_9VIBR|nr:hypothetical protein [Vibrio fortis]KAB0300974.1 hypothetical protein F2Z80_17980 [Vibrio fortis]